MQPRSVTRRLVPDPLPPTLLLLTVTTGLVDAVSFLGLGHIFTANMTGNVVFLAFAIAGAQGISASASILALGCFLAGAGGGGLLARKMEATQRRWLVVASGSESVLLAGAAGLAIGVPINGSFAQIWPIVALTAAAMGIRNATVRRLGVADLTTTVLTLTLTGLAADSSLVGGTNPRPTRRIGSLIALFGGALLGAALVLHVGLVWPLVIASGAAVIATAAHAVRPMTTATPDDARPVPQPGGGGGQGDGIVIAGAGRQA